MQAAIFTIASVPIKYRDREPTKYTIGITLALHCQKL